MRRDGFAPLLNAGAISSDPMLLSLILRSSLEAVASKDEARALTSHKLWRPARAV
jgi:hypothetical protein